MSMVGPRPERQQFIDKLEQQIPGFNHRLAVKPGLTGWAQVNYGYGSTIEDARIELSYDLEYCHNQSLARPPSDLPHICCSLQNARTIINSSLKIEHWGIVPTSR
jgi:Bacterial sugar transferase